MSGGSSEDVAPEPVENAGLSHEEAIAVIRRTLEELQFGSVLIKVHQGEVVGIETSTKLRFRQTK
jgi:hypothetical protein